MTPNPWPILGIVAASFLAGGYSSYVYMDREAKAAEIAQQSAILAAQKEASDTEALWQRSIADIEQTVLIERNLADVEINGLRRAVESGAVKLRIASANRKHLSDNSASACTTDAASAELDPDVRQDYYALRDGLEKQRLGLIELQGYVKSISQ